MKAELLKDFSTKKVALVRNVNSPKKLHKFSPTPPVTMATQLIIKNQNMLVSPSILFVKSSEKFLVVTKTLDPDC